MTPCTGAIITELTGEYVNDKQIQSNQPTIHINTYSSLECLTHLTCMSVEVYLNVVI